MSVCGEARVPVRPEHRPSCASRPGEAPLGRCPGAGHSPAGEAAPCLQTVRARAPNSHQAVGSIPHPPRRAFGSRSERQERLRRLGRSASLRVEAYRSSVVRVPVARRRFPSVELRPERVARPFERGRAATSELGAQRPSRRAITRSAKSTTNKWYENACSALVPSAGSDGRLGAEPVESVASPSLCGRKFRRSDPITARPRARRFDGCWPSCASRDRARSNARAAGATSGPRRCALFPRTAASPSNASASAIPRIPASKPLLQAIPRPGGFCRSTRAARRSALGVSFVAGDQPCRCQDGEALAAIQLPDPFGISELSPPKVQPLRMNRRPFQAAERIS